jgi:hypothetical protein
MSDNNRSKKTGASPRSGSKSQTTPKPRKKPELTEEQLQMVMPKRKHSQVFDDVIAILIIALGIFLIISLQTFGHIVMNHIGHIGLIDPHAECVGRNHYPLPVKQEILLVLPPFLRVQPGMIAGG